MFFAALVVAVASFAAPATTPTKADLLDFYEPGQLCVCVYFEAEICNDVVFAGSYQGGDNWITDPAVLAKFAPLEGFEGWYYVAVTDESEQFKGKPVQLNADGTFAWENQTGDPASWEVVAGTVNITPGYEGEADLAYSIEEPVILISKYFKNHKDICSYVAEYKDYTIRLNAPFCAGPDGTYYDPAIIGDFNGWSEGVAATYIDEETFEYVFELKQAEKTKAFKFKALGDTDWSNQIQLLDTAGNWYDNPNLTLGDETEISIDYSEGRFTLCAPAKELTTLTYNVTVPAGTHTCYLVGDMNGWAFTNEMTKVDATHFTITLNEVHDGMGYKYCCGPDWKYEEKTATGEGVSNRSYNENDVVEAWAEVYVPTAVDNVVFDKASAVKKIINGQMVVEMNGKFFNILGTEVK